MPVILTVIFAPALLVAAQVGPFSTGSGGSVGRDASPVPQELRDRKARSARPAASPVTPPTRTPGRLEACMAGIEGDATAAARQATDWLAQTQGSARSEPQLCLGAALSAQARWPEAEAAFLGGRDAAAASDIALRARLGAMAGNAALAAGAPDRALAALDAAAALVRSTEDKATLATIAIDRARAAVALKDNALAEAALTEAREADPANAQGWLLSATLSRRQGQLQAAQTQIERAAALAPLDAEIGLEAGVIAELSGREDAARRSWRSVVATAPGSEAARTAQGYLDQIGPGSATSATVPPQGR